MTFNNSNTLCNVFIYNSILDLSNSLYDYISKKSYENILDKGKFIIALSGGSMSNVLVNLHERDHEIEFDKWHICFVDERIVSLEDNNSNYNSYRSIFSKIKKLKIENIITIENLLDIEQEANAYESKILSISSEFVVDLALLGIGEDGNY